MNKILKGKNNKLNGLKEKLKNEIKEITIAYSFIFTVLL
jgi:hypothetical protein